MPGTRPETGVARHARLTRSLPTVLLMLAVALAGGCSTQPDDATTVLDQALEDARTDDADGNDPAVRRDDVHPLLRDDRDGSNNVEVPTSYPHTVELPDGGSVVYHQGPTPGGHPWAVAFLHADGAVEIQELDDDGVVQARTYGMTSGDGSAGNSAP